MTSKAVVAGVLALAAVAAADALDRGSGTRPTQVGMPRAGQEIAVGRGSPGEFAAAGHYLQTRVLRKGREYLSAAAIDGAFPSPHEGPFDIADLALAEDGTLAVAVYRFPADHPAHAGVELWRGRALVGAFTVPSGTAGGGLTFSADGRLIVITSADGRRVSAFTRAGRRAL